jgi:hypothetical protein
MSPGVISPGVNNVIVPICRGRSTGIDDDRFELTMGSIVYIYVGIVLTRRLMCAVGSQALMCAEGMIIHTVMEGNVRGGTTHGRISRGMKYAVMFVDNRPMTCNCGGRPTNRGIPAGRNMEWQVRTLRGRMPRFSEYCWGGHTPMVVVNVDVACAAQ